MCSFLCLFPFRLNTLVPPVSHGGQKAARQLGPVLPSSEPRVAEEAQGERSLGPRVCKGQSHAGTSRGGPVSTSPEPIFQGRKPRHMEIKSLLPGGSISECRGGRIGTQAQGPWARYPDHCPRGESFSRHRVLRRVSGFLTSPVASDERTSNGPPAG